MYVYEGWMVGHDVAPSNTCLCKACDHLVACIGCKSLHPMYHLTCKTISKCSAQPCLMWLPNARKGHISFKCNEGSVCQQSEATRSTSKVYNTRHVCRVL